MPEIPKSNQNNWMPLEIYVSFKIFFKKFLESFFSAYLWAFLGSGIRKKGTAECVHETKIIWGGIENVVFVRKEELVQAGNS